jgi:hypothetical protein
MTIPAELLYLLVALGIGALLYRYFTTRGGIELLRADYARLPAEGQIDVRQHLVRWQAADDGSFKAAWPLESGQALLLEVAFDGSNPDEPDLGRLEVRVDRHRLVRGVSWTEKIRDRTLRSDVEAVLRALQHEAAISRSDRTRVRGARSVGDDRPSLEGGHGADDGTSAPGPRDDLDR